MTSINCGLGPELAEPVEGSVAGGCLVVALEAEVGGATSGLGGVVGGFCKRVIWFFKVSTSI